MLLKKFKFPEPLVLLMGCIALASFFTYLIPAGAFNRNLDVRSGKEVVVPGSFHYVESQPVDFFEMLIAIPKGMLQAGDVIFFVFLVGGAFYVFNKTGAFSAFVELIATKLAHHQMLVIPICIVLFGSLGAIQNFQEEIIPLVPILLLLCRRLGFNNTTAVAISIGAAVVGAAFSPINPFQVGIAQKVSSVDLLSGALHRTIFLVLGMGLYVFFVYRYALKTKKPIENHKNNGIKKVSTSDKMVLGLLLLTFAVLVMGVSTSGWGFEEMAALFFLSGIIAGLLGGLRINGTVSTFIEGFKDMAYAGLLIGFARAIFVVLEEGQIVDSLVNGMFTPLSDLPKEISLLGITAMQSIIHFPVPSVSGQAVLTMPLLAPLADLMQISRDLMILCYQYGAGLAELLVPTNGAIMAILAACGVPYENWVKFVWKIFVVLLLLGFCSIYLAYLISF